MPFLRVKHIFPKKPKTYSFINFVGHKIDTGFKTKEEYHQSLQDKREARIAKLREEYNIPNDVKDEEVQTIVYHIDSVKKEHREAELKRIASLLAFGEVL